MADPQWVGLTDRDVPDTGSTATAQPVRATALVAALVAATNIVALCVDPRDRADASIFIVDSAHGLIALVVAVWFARTKWRSVLCAELGFIAVAVPFAAGLWLPAVADFQSGHLTEPLMPHHFLLLGIAIAAPTVRSGGALLSLFATHALVLKHVLENGGEVPTLSREPWMTLLFTAIAGMLLLTRSRRRSLEQRVAAAEERARMLVDVARMLVALRDRANTPLQTIEIAVQLLAEDGAASEQVSAMARALRRLASVQEMLARSGAELATIAGDPAVSPGDLEQSLRELLRT